MRFPHTMINLLSLGLIIFTIIVMLYVIFTGVR